MAFDNGWALIRAEQGGSLLSCVWQNLPGLSSILDEPLGGLLALCVPGPGCGKANGVRLFRDPEELGQDWCEQGGGEGRRGRV